MKQSEGKMKFLAVKLSALRLELNVSREIMRDVTVEVEKMFNKKYFPERPVNQAVDENSDIEHREETQRARVEANVPEPESADRSVDPHVRKMFKKIATKCHPDKLAILEDGFEKSRKEELFDKARTAFEEDDIVTMAHVAMELGVEVPEITKAQLKEAENKIIAIKDELAHIESTYVWRWFFTSNPEQKENILQELFMIMYENARRQNIRT
tara:strand:+ start:407 stop:1042 length:636 start_codon:yes stop_codon:yes gene_type:complete